MEANPHSEFKVILGSSSMARKKILADMGYQFTTMSADIDEKAIRKEKPEELVVALAEAKADAIISKLQNIENQEKDVKPTILIAADTAEAIIPRLQIEEYKADAEPTLLITCDQVVVYEGNIREKPSSKDEARHYIEGYSGGYAATVSSVVVTNLKSGIRRGECDKVEVQSISLGAANDIELTRKLFLLSIEEPLYINETDGYDIPPKEPLWLIHFQDIPEQVIDSLIEEGNVLNVAGALIIEHPLIQPYVKEVVGATDSVMGLPKALTDRLIKEVL